MKKILISLSVIAAVAAIVIGGTMAYFSNTETSNGNTISSGALDLTLNGHNNVTEAVVSIADMKPSQVWYSGPITLDVYNNPGRIYKQIVNEGDNPIACEDVTFTEPECEAEGGAWTDGEGCSISESQHYLPDVTWIDIERWEDFNKNGVIDNDEWVTMLPDQTKKIADLSPDNGSKWIYLGTYGYPMMSNKLVIRQSFHMDADTGNEYQADKCTFTEKFMVTQTNAGEPTDTYVPPENVVLDSIDIGDSDSVSMIAHNAQKWFNDPQTGNYGNRDGGETIAMVGGDDDDNGICDADESDATFELDAGIGTANKLIIRHLDGSANDSFDVYIDGVLVGNYVGGQTTDESWVTTTFDLAGGGHDFTGKKTIRLNITGNYPWSSCLTYGQGAFNWAKITN